MVNRGVIRDLLLHACRSEEYNSSITKGTDIIGEASTNILRMSSAITVDLIDSLSFWRIFSSTCGNLVSSGISRACAHLLKCVSPGLTFPIAHCYNTRQCTAAIAAMPCVVLLLMLGEGIIGKLHKRNRTDRYRQTDSYRCCLLGWLP